MHINPQMEHRGKELDKSAIYDTCFPPPTKEVSLDILRKHLDDTSLLQEITKKYILIPKRSSLFVNEFADTIKPAIAGDSNWKSKYDILNELKQKDKVEREKEKENPIKDDDPLLQALSNKQILKTLVTDIPDTKQCQKTEYATVTPDEDLNKINTNKLQEICNDDIKNNEIIKCNEKIYYKNNTQIVCPHVINDLECKVTALGIDQEITESVECIKSIEKTELLIDSNINAPLYDRLECSNNIRTEPEQQNGSLEIHDQNYTQPSIISAVKSYDLTNNTTNSNNVIAADEFNEIESTQYPIDIINVQEFTPEENVILEEGVNINPHFDREDTSLPHETTQHESVIEVLPVDSVDISGIEAFDAEQREMFYSEQPGEKYSYDQTNPESTYHDPENRNNYQQNEEYNYYEGVPQDQNYSAEVNEFEETSQPYDPTYQEQYAAYDPVSYMPQETYEQEPQQYEEIQDINLSIQPEMEQLQYEQLNNESEIIEKQLDDEQGYTENEEFENTNSQFTDITANQKKNVTDQALDNSEIQENMIPENTLNN